MSSNPNSALNALVGGVGGGPLGSLAGQGLSLSSLAGQAALGNTIHTGVLGAIQNLYPHPTSAPPTTPVTRLLRIVMEDGKTYGVIVDGGVNHNDTLPALPLEQAEATVKMMHDIAEQERQEQMRRHEMEEEARRKAYDKSMHEQMKQYAKQMRAKQFDAERAEEIWFGTLATPDEYEERGLAKEGRSIVRRIKDALTQNKTQQEKSK